MNKLELLKKIGKAIGRVGIWAAIGGILEALVKNTDWESDENYDYDNYGWDYDNWDEDEDNDYDY